MPKAVGYLLRESDNADAFGSGSGDVIGPASSVDNRVARFDGTGGKTIQSSLVRIGDDGALAVVDGTSGLDRIGFTPDNGGGAGAFFLYDPARTVQCSFNQGASGTNFSSQTPITLSASDVLIWTNGIQRFIMDAAGAASFAGSVSFASHQQIDAQASDPAAPASGKARFYARTYAGTPQPWWRGPAGASYALSPQWGLRNIRMWRGGAGIAGSNFAAQIGAMPYTGSSPSAPTIPALASTNRLTQTRRSTISSGASAGGLAYIRSDQTQVWRGNAAGLGGFLAIWRIALSGTLVSGLRAFAGLVDVTANPTNVDPTTTSTPGGVGLACNTNSGNWSLVHNVTGTGRTAIGLGSNFPVNNTDLLELALWCEPNGSGISWQVTNLSTGNTTSGTISSNLPASATFLAPSVWVTNNATAAAQTLDFISVYLETEY